MECILAAVGAIFIPLDRGVSIWRVAKLLWQPEKAQNRECLEFLEALCTLKARVVDLTEYTTRAVMSKMTSSLKEIGGESVITISTAKSANGVEQLRDNNIQTFWQSDGTAPHLINIQFTKKVSVCSVCLQWITLMSPTQPRS